MGITLYNAMKLGDFRECEVVAGHEGLSKTIEGITIMEVPDVVQWLKHKELLLTSLYAIKDDEEAQSILIQKLHDAGATAIAIKPFYSFKKIPDIILESADKLGFPVIRIPEKIKYLDILSPVMHVIFNQKVVLQEDIEQASRILNQVSLNSQGIDAFIETLGYLTNNVITIESQLSFIKLPKSNVVVSPLTTEEVNELSFIKYPICLKRQYNNKDTSCIVAPIVVEGQVYGNITCWGINSDHLEIDLAILEKASTLLSLEFLRLKVKYDVEQQYKNDFMRELLFNESINEGDLLEWGEKYHLSNDKRYLCILLNDENTSIKTDSLIKLAEINNIIQKQWSEAIIGRIRDFVCIIFPSEHLSEHSYREHCKTLFKHLKYYLGNRFVFRMGAGRDSVGLKGIRISFLQAEQSLKLTNSDKKIIFYDDLGIYRLLNYLTSQKEFFDFYNDTVGKLVEYDMNHDLNLTDTLKTYFYHNENLKVTSEKLYIHVNTLKYRINKIESITGYSLRNSDEKMMLYTGMKIEEILNC